MAQDLFSQLALQTLSEISAADSQASSASTGQTGQAQASQSAPSPTRSPKMVINPFMVDAIASEEGLTDTQKQVMTALLNQESNYGRNARTSTDGARGVGQIMPATFQRYARPGERIDDPAHNLAVMSRIVKDAGSKFGDDPAKIATAYFSGDGNVNRGQGPAWKSDRADGNGKRVSSYVSDVVSRVGRGGGVSGRVEQPQEWDQGARYAPVGLTLGGTDKPKAAEDGEPESIVPSLGKAIWQGAKSLGRSVLASGNTALGDLSDVELLAEAQKADAKENPRAMMALQEEIAKRKEANPDAAWWQALGDVGDAAWKNKLGTAQLIANQAPNSAVALGGGWAGGLAGAKLGALAAPFTGGLSVPVGAGLGALTGMFLGNYAMEAGGKAIDRAEGGFTPEEARQSMAEGAKKAAVVTGVDAATLGAGKLVGRTVFGAPVRAGARAEAQVLANAGVDITNKAAIAQALATNQALKQTAIEAGKQAAKDASKWGTRAAQAGTGLTMETLGEGAGEYYGEMAATGKGDVYDAALEALSSATQSVPQTAMAMRSSSGNDLDPSGIVRAARQSGGIASRASLASTPGAQQQAAAPAQPAAQQAAAAGAAAQPATNQPAGSTAPAQPAQTAIQASALSAIEQALEADKQRRRTAGEVVEDDVTEGDVVAAGDPPAAVLTDPPGAQASTPAQPATSAGFSLPAFDNSPLPKTDPAAAEEQRRQAAEFEQKRKNRRAGTRAAVWERNPMLAFLGANGISRDAAGEFAPGLIERRKAFVPGYGPVFRPGAKNLDELVQNAKEDGFLREDDGEPELYDLIDRALRGERISPLYADGAAEAEGQRRLQAMQERDGADFEDYLAQAEAEDFDPFPLMDDSSYDEQDLAEIGRADVAVQNEVAALQQQYADLGFDPADVLESLATQTENLSDQAYYDLAKSRFIQLIDQAYGQSEAQAEQGGDRIVRLDTGPQGDAQEDGGAAGGQAAGPVTPPAAPVAASPKRADAIRAKLDGLKAQGFSQFTRSSGRTLLLNPDTYESVELTPAEMAVAKAAASQARASLQSLRGQRKPVQVDQQGVDVLQSYTPADVLAQDEQAQAAQAQQTAEQQAAADKAKADDERRRIEQASYAAADSFELGQNPLDSLTGQQDIFSAAPAAAPVAADLAGKPINDEWTAFGPQSGTLGIPRAEMPQIKAEHRGAMVNFLKARGIDGQQETIPAAAIKPTQAEFSPAKVKQAIDYQGGNRSIIVSADGYVVDGHHQWLAAREKGEPIQAIRLDQNIGDVLAALKDMPSAQPEQGGRQDAARDYEADMRLYPSRVLEQVGANGELAKLYAKAGVRGADAFGGLNADDRAAAYAAFVADGGKPAGNLPQSYNDSVMEEERQIRRRQLQDERTITQANGKPFKTEASAKVMLDQFDLSDTHKIVSEGGGYALRQMPPAEQAEVRRKAEGRESYMEAQAAVIAEMGIPETADGEIDATDDQWDEIDQRIAERLGRRPVAGEQSDAAPAQQGSRATPVFEVYADALKYVEDRAKELGLSKQKFTTTDEYKALYPQIKALYDAEKASNDAERLQALKDAGLAAGDKVKTVVRGMFMSADEYTGTVVMRSGAPYVQIDGKMTVSRNGRLSETSLVRWDGRWTKEAGSQPSGASSDAGGQAAADQPIASKPFATDIEKTKTGWKILGDPEALADHARNIFGKGVVKRKDGISLATKTEDVAGNFPVRFDEYRLADLPERHGRIEVRVNQDGSASVRSLDGGYMGPLLPSVAEAIANHRNEFGGGESKPEVSGAASADSEPQLKAIRDVADKLGMEYVSGLLADSLKKGQTFSMQGKQYTVTAATDSRIRLKSSDGKNIEALKYGNKLVSGGNAKSQPYAQFVRDLEGVISVDLINENNPFHKPSEVFVLAQKALDALPAEMKAVESDAITSPSAGQQEAVVDRSSEAFNMGRNAALRGFTMDPPGGVIRSKKDKASYEAGWMEGRRQENSASASDVREDVLHSGYTIQPIRSEGKEAWQIKGRTPSDGISNSGTFASLESAKQEVDRVVAADRLLQSDDKGAETEAALTVDLALEAIFDQLDGITQRTQAAGQQAAAAHPQAERIQLVQKHILDILEDLEDSGKVTINC